MTKYLNIKFKLMKSISFLFVFFFLLSFSFGQVTVHNNGAVISVNDIEFTIENGDFTNADIGGNSKVVLNGTGGFYVGGNVTNGDSIFVYDGKLQIDNSYSHIASSGSYLYNESGVYVGENWNCPNNGTYWTDTSIGGILILNGTATQDLYSSTNSLYHEVQFTGGGQKNINGYWDVIRVEFEDGIVHQNSDLDTFVVNSGDGLLDYNLLSFYRGEFFLRGKGDLTFPIGRGNDLRPLSLIGVTQSSLFSAEVSNSPSGIPSGSEGRGILVNSLQRGWHFKDIEGDYTGAKLDVGFVAADISGTGVSSPSELSLAQAENYLTDKFNSIGNSNTYVDALGFSHVTSELNASGDFYFTLGAAGSNAKVDVRILLEGAYNGSSGMDVDNNYQNFVDVKFSDNAPGNDFTNNYGMYPGYSIPKTTGNNTVDIIAVMLREATAPYNYVDTSWALLMEDGSVRDLASGMSPYVKFNNATIGESYYVEVQHHNHLPVMSNIVYVASTSIPTSYIDFRSETNIWGGGGVVQHGADFYVIGGNAYNSDLSINALDFVNVKVDQSAAVTGYGNSNVSFDNDVNASDYNVAGNNSLYLKYSTKP